MLNLNSFFSDDLNIHEICIEGEEIIIALISSQGFSNCPLCGEPSNRNHSHYDRTLMDLPILGCTVYLNLHVRKFFCDNSNCERKVFTERFTKLIEPYARRTDRLEESIVALAFSSNAVTNGKLSEKLAFAISDDTILRIIRRTPIQTNQDEQYIGIDDFAFRKGNNYGTIICSLETHRPIDLLEDRTSDTLEKWLRKHPGILVTTRDRSKSYAKAIKNACPEATQVADRFHLAQNLLDAVKEFAKRAFSSKIPLGFEELKNEFKSEKNPDKQNLSPKESRLLEVLEKKKETVREVKILHKNGMSNRKISRIMRMCHKTVSRYIREDEEIAIIRRPRANMLDPYADLIKELICLGESAESIFRTLKNIGYPGEISLLRRYVRKLKSEGFSLDASNKKNSEERIKNLLEQKKKVWIKRYDAIHYLWVYDHQLDKKEKDTLKTIFRNHPIAEKVHSLIQDFRDMLKNRKHQELDTWIAKAIKSSITEIVNFAKGLKETFVEVYNALVYPYSNGIVEGNVNRLKMIKRLMYGRAKFDLLRQRVLYQM